MFLTPCGGCRFHKLPYTADIPVKIDGDYVTKEFKSMEDVWGIVDMLINEEKLKNKSKSLDVDSLYSISKQLPFFTCPSLFYNKESSEVISKYYYCKEFGIPPHEGTYNEQPSRWIEYAFLISNCLSKKEAAMYAKASKDK